MISGKDLTIDKDGNIILNGDKYPLASQAEIDTAVKDVYSVMGQMGAKNLNIFPYKNGGAGDTWESSGITFTVNADGTIEANGTATADAYFRCGTSTDDSNPIYLEAGKSYILSGTGTTGVGVILRDSNNLVATAGETDVVYNCTSSGKYYILVLVRKQKTVDHFIIKPMLRLAADTDNTYEPYAMTNKQLTETIGDITQTGVTGATVAAQLAALQTGSIKVAAVSGTVDSTTADSNAIGGYRTVGQTTKALSSLTGYPTGKTVVGWSLSAYGANAATLAVVHVGAGHIYLNSAYSGTFTVEGFVFYTD